MSNQSHPAVAILKSTNFQINGLALAVLLSASELLLEQGNAVCCKTFEFDALKHAVRDARITLGIGTKDDVLHTGETA